MHKKVVTIFKWLAYGQTAKTKALPFILTINYLLIGHTYPFKAAVGIVF